MSYDIAIRYTLILIINLTIFFIYPYVCKRVIHFKKGSKLYTNFFRTFPANWENSIKEKKKAKDSMLSPQLNIFNFSNNPTITTR